MEKKKEICLRKWSLFNGLLWIGEAWLENGICQLRFEFSSLASTAILSFYFLSCCDYRCESDIIARVQIDE